MIYAVITIFFIFSIIATAFVILGNKKRKAEKKLLEDSWGKKILRHRNFYSIGKYKLSDTESNCYNLTEQTLADIDIELLFEFVDRTQTTIGQQYLFSKLVTPSLCVDVLKDRGTYSDYFVKNETVRKKIQFFLKELEKKETDLVADFFKSETKIIKNKYNTPLRILSILAALSMLTCWLYPLIAIFMLFLFGINLMIHLIFRHNNSSKLKAIRQVYQLIKAVGKLTHFNLPVQAEQITSAKIKLANFKKTYNFLDFGIPQDDISTIVFYFLDLIKSFFLTEVHLLNYSYNEVIKNKDALKEFYIYVGKIDMALSTASIKNDDIGICVPVFQEESKFISCDSMIHPLVTGCIPNSILLNSTNAFITGSNMSGKSTFLRAVLINSILAQSLYVCFANSFKSSIIRALSSIKISDNLQQGTSYYFEEVNIIHEMVLNINSGNKNLFIIDEIFKGTNTVERIALSKAILQNLSSPENIVIASSHDIELIELLNEEFELYHFTESIINNQLHFDHTIKAGALKTRNAIKIIEMEGFPVHIVEEAKSLALDLKNKTSIT